MIFCRGVTPVASQRIPGIDGILDFGNVSGFNRRQCVRDWSGILCERFWERGLGMGLGNGIWERGLGTGTRSLSLSKCRTCLRQAQAPHTDSEL